MQIYEPYSLTQNTENMENLTEFNHEAENLSEALGVSEDRVFELHKIIIKEVLNIQQTKSQSLSNLIDKSRSLGEVAFCFHLYIMTMAKMEEMGDNSISRIMGMIDQVEQFKKNKE